MKGLPESVSSQNKISLSKSKQLRSFLIESALRFFNNCATLLILRDINMKVSIKDRYFFFGIDINILLRDCVDQFLYRTNFCIGPISVSD